MTSLARAASTKDSSGFVAHPLSDVVRIYWSSPAGGQTCSGTVLTRGLILTAGHCVYSNPTDGQPEHGFTGYYDRSTYTIVPENTITNGQRVAPFGSWTVRNMWTTTTYASQPPAPPSVGRDWGIIEVNPNASGAYPGDVTGGVAAQWDAPIQLDSELYLVGYAASNIFAQTTYGGGDLQFFCDMRWAGTRLQDPTGSFADSWPMDFQPCQLNGGASGGPVFLHKPDGTWVVVGVNNRGNSVATADPSASYGNDMMSFWLDGAFGVFWNYVVGLVNAGQ